LARGHHLLGGLHFFLVGSGWWFRSLKHVYDFKPNQGGITYEKNLNIFDHHDPFALNLYLFCLICE
jgi:hypothetical protein